MEDETMREIDALNKAVKAIEKDGGVKSCLFILDCQYQYIKQNKSKLSNVEIYRLRAKVDSLAEILGMEVVRQRQSCS